jgi:membrane-bound serine protease (ClpP class)
MLLLRIVVFFILEATVTSYGLLAIREVVAMLFGSMMLIKTDVEFLQNERRAHHSRASSTFAADAS